MAKTAKNILPAYLTDIYGWLYLNPKLYNLLDNAFLLNFLTLGYHSLLTEEVKKEISPHSHILQIGATLGGQIEKAYSGLGMLGSYTIVDILPDILENCREKHLEQKIGFVHADAAKTVKGNYDIIICYMLLHELPPLTRTRVIDNILKALKPGGKSPTFLLSPFKIHNSHRQPPVPAVCGKPLEKFHQRPGIAPGNMPLVATNLFRRRLPKSRRHKNGRHISLKFVI